MVLVNRPLQNRIIYEFHDHTLKLMTKLHEFTRDDMITQSLQSQYFMCSK